MRGDLISSLLVFMFIDKKVFGWCFLGCCSGWCCLDGFGCLCYFEDSMVELCFVCCFVCIDCFFFYVFNIIVELKMVVCCCGEDIIDLSMGNFDGLILLYIVEKFCIVV